MASSACASLNAVAALLLMVVSPADAMTASFRLRAPYPRFPTFPKNTTVVGRSIPVHEVAMMAETSLFYGICGCATLVFLILSVCCIWDGVAQWLHWSRFRACERKLRQANDAFSNRKGELLLCPCCVESLTPGSSPSKVVFLCGHRFHTDCCNAWASESPSTQGRCPICCDAQDPDYSNAPYKDREDPEAASACKHANLLKCVSKNEASEFVDVPIDDAQSFVLRSLHKQFPDIIPEASLRRWVSCHTQIWLSELTCPRYNSLLHKQLKPVRN